MLQAALAVSAIQPAKGGGGDSRGGGPAPGDYWTSNAYQAAIGTAVLTTNLADGSSGDQTTYVEYAPGTGIVSNITIFRVWATAQALNTVTVKALLGEAIMTWEVERWTGAAWSNDIKNGIAAPPANFQPTWSTLTQNLKPALTTTMIRVSLQSRTDVGGGDGPVMRVGDWRFT